MAFQGGVIGTLGITPSYISTLGTVTAQNGTILGLGQVWQGAGQSYFGSAGQSLAGNLAGSAVNIALNSALGTQVVGPQGIPLTSGTNILASTITPFVTSTIAAGINQNLQQSLQAAGPFGPLLSSLGTNLVNQAFGSVASGLGAASTNVENYKMFPGADGIGEAPAVYNNGSAYTLTDIVFSIQPANQGPQQFGQEQAISDPKSATTVATTQIAGNSGTATSAAQEQSNTIKAEKMVQNTSAPPEEDKAILKFMQKGLPPNVTEFNKLSKVEQEVAVNLAEQSKEFLAPLPAAGYFGSWSFITAPEDVSWDIANQANRVDIFGTNNPPVVAGSRGMRDLTLSNALVEGFVRGVSLEGKIAALEKLMNYSLNSSDGYVSVPVYQVWASEKSYGGSNAYYIIKDIKVKETMRDLKGNATRAFVDISLMQVPAYQVQSGRDQASQVTAGGVAIQQRQGVAAQGNQNMQGKGGTPATNGNSKPGAGPNAGGKASTSGFQGGGILPGQRSTIRPRPDRP